MTSPVLLATPTPLPVDTDTTAKRDLPPFGVILAHHPSTGPGPSSPFASTAGTDTSLSLVLECDAYDHDPDHDHDQDASSTRGRTIDVRRWTGAPIRAIVPLPRRKLDVAAHGGGGGGANASHAAQRRPLPFVTRVHPHLWDDDDVDDADVGKEEGDGDVEVEGGLGRDVPPGSSRYCSYESITAAEGLSAWSFEELRTECYAQSLVARGTKPSPVVQPSLAIPPAFIPRFVSRR